MNENGRKTLCKDEFANCEIVKENQQLQQELQKYKSLYENEKDHTDTLKRIIKKIEEYIKNIDEEEFVNTEHYIEILDLLKEIK